MLLVVRDRELAVHLPAHPQQQQRAGEQQPAAERQQLRGDQRKADAQDRRSDDADEDGFASEVRRQSGSREADDDRIVAGKNQIDDDNVEECRKCRCV